MSRAFEHGDLTLVYPIARSTPAFLPLISVPLLGELDLARRGLRHRDRGGGHLAGRRRRRALALGASRRTATRFAFLTLAAGVGYSLIDKVAMTRSAPRRWTSPLPRAFVYAVLLGISGGAVFAPLAWLRTRERPARRACARPSSAARASPRS